ncbi:MAG: FtsW/RodA/SpoVE family cell cycle protein [Fibrobacter sp.]|nr:FtsW/RodA/SpoVE family cell cycle protein [Fibrobacter sp.]
MKKRFAIQASDLLVPALFFLISIIGMVAIWGFSLYQQSGYAYAPNVLLFRQGVQTMLGILLALTLVRLNIDYRKFAIPCAIAAVSLLILALLFPVYRSDFRQWTGFYIITIHSGTVSILLLLPLIVKLLSKVHNECKGWGRVWTLVAVVIAVNILLLLQPDTAVLAAFNIMVLFLVLVSEMPIARKAVVGAFLVACGITAFGFLAKFNNEYNNVVFKKNSNKPVLETVWPESPGFRVRSAKEDLSEGGILGKGLSAYRNTTERRYSKIITDSSVFQIIAREFGIAGLAFVISMFMVAFFLMGRGTLSISDRFSRFTAQGVLVILVFAFVVNLLKTFGIVRLAPFYQTPFLGYGRSWTYFYWLCTGVYLQMRI